MLIEGVKNRSKERDDIFFTGGKLYIGVVAEPEPKSLEQLSAVRKMPVDGSRSHAGRRGNGFMGGAIEPVTAQHAHGNIEDLFSGRGGLPCYGTGPESASGWR